MLFTELLAQQKLERTGVSHGIQQMMKRYDKFVKAVADAKEKLKTASDTAKPKIEREITEGEENMTSLNETICQRIENYVKNKPLNDKRAEILKNARDSKGNNKGAKVVEFSVESFSAKVFGGHKLTTQEEIKFYNDNKAAIDTELERLTTEANKGKGDDATHLPVPVAKKSSIGKVVLAVLGTAVVIGAAIFGIKAYNKSKSE